MANRIIRSSLFFALFTFMAIQPAAAIPVDHGAATTYDVTLKKLELCASGSAIDETGSTEPTCVSPFVLGSSERHFDISSVSAGAELGSYGSIAGLPAGTVYTHVRMTLSRSFSIAGTLSISGCRTDSEDQSSSTTSAGVGIHDSGTGTPQTLVIADVGAYGGGFPSQSEYYENGLALAGSDFTYMVPLAAPFTIAGTTMPDVRVSFNTQTGLSGIYAGEVCTMYPNYPSIEITVTGGTTPPT